MNTFSIRGALNFGWETFKKRPWLFVGAMCIVALVQIGLSIIGYIPLIGWIISSVVGIYVGMGIVQFSLAAHDSVEDETPRSLWAPHPFWKYVGGNVAVGLISTGPLALIALVWATVRLIPMLLSGGKFVFNSADGLAILLGVAGVLWAVFAGVHLLFVKYLVMDRNIGPIVSARESFRITKGSWWRLFFLGVILGLLNFVGALLLFVGLFVTIPITIMAMAHVYRTLEHKAHEMVPAQ